MGKTKAREYAETLLNKGLKVDDVKNAVKIKFHLQRQASSGIVDALVCNLR